MKATVVCMASPKGGSGKTITSANMAALLAGLKKKVLLMDCDCSTNGLTLFYLRWVNDGRKESQVVPSGLFDALGDPKTCDLSDSVSLIPATYTLSDTQRHARLGTMISPLI